MSMSNPVLFYGSSGLYAGLSNFYPAPIRIGGRVYPTVEHYFQSRKSRSRAKQEQIRGASTPAIAKHLGRDCTLREDWEKIKVGVMRRALRAKFRQHSELRALLLSTGDRPLHEDAPFDRVWGYLGGEGQDLLGKLLMELRTELREEASDA
jgi:N-glycosidase YbiA